MRRRSTQYDALRLALEMPAPGYVIHESAVWSDFHHRCHQPPCMRGLSMAAGSSCRGEPASTGMTTRRTSGAAPTICSSATVHCPTYIDQLRVDEAFTTVEILGAGPLNPLHGACI